jgi:predicted  nucleic acid-binding Zn-ribbon protein
MGLVLAGMLVKYIYSLAQDIHKMAAQVAKMEASVSHEKGSPLIHYDLMRAIEAELQELRQDAEAHATNANKHYEDVIRLNSQEVYARCNIDKCPHLITVIGNIRNVGALFEQFSVKAEESRNSTGASLKDIQGQMQVLAAEVSAQSKQVVQLLGDVLVGRKPK